MSGKKTAIITLIVAIVVGLASFFGGTAYEKNSLAKQNLLRDPNQPRLSRGTGGQGGQGMAFAGNRGGGPNGNGGFVAGQVMSVDDPANSGAGKSLTIKTQDGSSKIVFFSDSTTVGKSVQGSAGDLSAGEQVMVSGQASADGTLTAQNIQIRPAGQPQ